MSYAVILGCPASWSADQVRLMADRLIADALPESVGVIMADAEGIDLPLFHSAILRARGEDD